MYHIIVFPDQDVSRTESSYFANNSLNVEDVLSSVVPKDTTQPTLRG